MTAARDNRHGTGSGPGPVEGARSDGPWYDREPTGYETSGVRPSGAHGAPSPATGGAPRQHDDTVFDIADDRRDAYNGGGSHDGRTALTSSGDLRGYPSNGSSRPLSPDPSSWPPGAVPPPPPGSGPTPAAGGHNGHNGYGGYTADPYDYLGAAAPDPYGVPGLPGGSALDPSPTTTSSLDRGHGYGGGPSYDTGHDRGYGGGPSYDAGHGSTSSYDAGYGRGPSYDPGYGSTSSYDPGYGSTSSYDPGYAATTAMPLAGQGSPYAPAPEGIGLPAPRSEPVPDASAMVAIIRSSFEAVSPRADELTSLFYGWLFSIAPETRELFPVTMELQRTRLLRALIHVVQMVDRPDELTVFLRQLGRDHRKFGVIGEHYDKVGQALLGAIGEIAGSLWTREVEQAWTTAYGIVAQAMREAADAERGPAVWMARVMEHRRISQDLAVVRVQTAQPVPYLAGQYVSVETPQRPRMWRSMSPANAPGSDCVLEFHVRTVPGGWVSRAIVSHARVGDVWRIGPPMGQMTLDPRSRADLLMVAGGTGLAPARALIEQLMLDGTDRKVCLFVGGRTWNQLYDIDTLRRRAQENPWLTVVPVVEDDGRPWGAETGTLAEVVARYGAWADRQTLIAGSPEMVRSTVSAMLEAGTPFTQIHYDPYHTD